MNRDSIIINFIKDNLKILQQTDFPYDLYKDRKHDFFYKVKNQTGKPKDTEIAQVAISYLINKNMIKKSDELERLLNSGFFKENIKEPQKFYDQLKIKSSNNGIIIDPAKIGQIEYRERIEDQLLEDVIDKNRQKIQEQAIRIQSEIDEKKRQLALIPTVVESKEFEEPPVNEQSDDDIKEWWQLLNLIDDPFPSAEGLQKIDKKTYDDIIVKTNIFTKYVSYIRDLPKQLFKNTIFYGDFGSGKTSFFDYIKEILIRNKILAIEISLWPPMDADIIIKDFEIGLIKRLQDWCFRLGIHFDDTHKESNIEIIRSLLYLLRNNFDGCIIIVDDLHKNAKAFKSSVMDFISYLQIFTSKLTKEISKELNMQIGIFLAGIPDWKPEISCDPRLSGSLIREEEFPLISVADANEMLNKRLIAFSKNPFRKNIVGKSFVIQVYEDLTNKNLPVTFRDFIKKTLDEFQKKNFDILTINPRAISKTNLSLIKDIILDNPNLSYKFDTLFSIGKNFHVENVRKCLEFLGIIYLEGGINEDSEQAVRNYWILQQLERCGLINFSYHNDKIKWFINKELLQKNKEVISRFSVSLEEYLIPIFFGKETQLSHKRIDRREIKFLKELLQIVTKEDQKYIIKDIIATHTRLDEIDRSHNIDIPATELVQLCIKSLAEITRIFPNFEIRHSNKDIEVLRFWKEFWYKPESVIEFLNQTIDRNEKIEIPHANYIFGLYKESFESIIFFIRQEFEKNKIISISYNDLTNEDSQVIYKVRDFWINRDYFPAIKTMNEYLENKSRETIFNLFHILYGSYEKRFKRIDEDTRKRMLLNRDKDMKKGLTKANDEFQYLDRKDYKKIMVNESQIGHQNWVEIFQYIFNGWTENFLKDVLNTFADLNTATSHLKTEVITGDQQNKLFRFILDSIDFIKKLNIAYRLIITKCIYQKDKRWFFSFHQFTDSNSLSEIDAKLTDVDYLIKKFKNMNEIRIDLSKQEYIENVFNIGYRTFMALISIFIKFSDQFCKERKLKFSIKEDKTPVFVFQLENI